MLWKKIHGGPKIRDISHKYNTVVNMQFVAGVAVTVVMCIAFLMPGGVCQAAGKTLYEPIFGERVYEPTFGERVYEPTFGERVYEPVIGKRGRWLSGKYTPAELENVAYLRCAKLKGFDNLLKCALEALGITQEEVGQAVEEYSKAMEEGNMQWK